MIGQNPPEELFALGLLSAFLVWWNLPRLHGWLQRRHRKRVAEAFEKSWRQHRMALDTLQIEAEKREQKSKR